MTDACEQCPLQATGAVASRGPVPAHVLLLSGAPRHHEEREGVAFASPLFTWLEESLATAGIDPAHVHYATLIGCRPPHQRPLRDAEIAACAPRLDLTVQAVEPRVIVLCGPDVVAALLPGLSLSNAHGTLARRGRRYYYPIRHPYTTLHSERYVAEVMDDLRRLAAVLDEEWPTEAEQAQQPDAPGAQSRGPGAGSGAGQASSPQSAPLSDTSIITPPDAMSLATGDLQEAGYSGRGIIPPPDAISLATVLEPVPPLMSDGRQEAAEQDGPRAEAVAIVMGGDADDAGDTPTTDAGDTPTTDAGDTPTMVQDEDGPTQLSLF